MENQIEQPASASNRNYSLEADLVTGWKPKLKIIGPMPLNFDNHAVDKSIMALLYQDSAFYTIVYLGPRPVSSFQLHQIIAKKYRFKYSYLLHNDFAHLKPFFKKFYAQFQSQIKRPYYGMSPSIGKSELHFDSCFESGNLDCAVRLRSNEYDLLLRGDSNTAGHILWYYFRVKNLQNTSKTVKFNIINLRRNKSSYERGMRPYVKRQDKQWKQEGQNVTVSQQRIKYIKQNLTLSMESNLSNNNHFQFYRKLSFQLNFEPGETIELAYSIPYTYSQLLDDIRLFKNKAKRLQDVRFQVDLSNQSLSGLEIPVLKIRSQKDFSDKYCIFMIGRQHPGQSNGSYVLKGSIQQLLSGAEQNLKIIKNCDFVIIPMLNPDGVIAGNFRTSLFGKDLNRLFKTKDTTLIPQIQMARNIFTQLAQTYKRRLLLFLDYHGHSTRKNAFVLGPGILDAHLLNDIRILPKIMAAQTQIFRFPSCSFRIDDNKKTTARALFGKMAGLSYTIQTSNWSYYSQATGDVITFTRQLWQQLGAHLFIAIQDFIFKKMQAKLKYNNRAKGQADKKFKIIRSKQDLKIQKVTISRQDSNTRSSKGKDIRSFTEIFLKEDRHEVADSLNDIKEYEKQSSQKVFFDVKEANSSDQMSQNQMDSDSEKQDMEQKKFSKYIKAASDMLVQFQKVYYGENYRKGVSKYRFNSNSNNILLKQKEKKKIQPIQACLRPKQKKHEQKVKLQDLVRQTKKTLFLQEQIFLRDSLIKPKNELKAQKSQQVGKNRNRLMQPLRKSKIIINQPFKNQLSGIAEQMSRVRRQQSEHIQRSRQAIINKQQRWNNRNIAVLIGSSRQLSIGLPSIKTNKVYSVKGIYHNHNVLSKQKLTNMISTEQLLNKSNFMNVLKISKVQKDQINL